MHACILIADEHFAASACTHAQIKSINKMGGMGAKGWPRKANVNNKKLGLGGNVYIKLNPIKFRGSRPPSPHPLEKLYSLQALVYIPLEI